MLPLCLSGPVHVPMTSGCQTKLHHFDSLAPGCSSDPLYASINFEVKRQRVRKTTSKHRQFRNETMRQPLGDLMSMSYYDNLNQPFGSPFGVYERSMPAMAVAPEAPLYTAITPRVNHDPAVASTSGAAVRAPTSHISLPPSLLRVINAPTKSNFNKLKLCLKLNDIDATNPRIDFYPLPRPANESGSFEEPQFTFSVGSHQIHSNQAYHCVFPANLSLPELSNHCLPELLQTVFSGHDAAFMYFGALSRYKQDLLYSRVPCTPAFNGLFVTAVQWTFRLIDEFRVKKKDLRYSVRLSALHYSQKRDHLIDLLADFGNDEFDSPVRATEDPGLGVLIENRTEVRVETVEQALFYLDRVYDHRFTEDQEIQRSSHTFFYLTLYKYESGENGVLLSGKSRLCLVDLGLGEKNSKSGFMTMPVLGNILLAIFQGQKHLPSRQNTLCRLLKESVGSAKNKATVLLSSFTPVEDRCPVETENLVQLASKMHKAVRHSISSPGARRVFKPPAPSDISVPPTEYTSSSEQSCAETVIFLGNGHLPTNHLVMGYNGIPLGPGTPSPSPIRRKSSRGSKSSLGRRSNQSLHSGTPEPPVVIPIDCPPNAVVHSSASLQSLSSPKRPTRVSGSMPGTPVQLRAQRQGSVPADLILCNPMARTASPKNTIRRSGNRQSSEDDYLQMDPEKREMILNWVIDQKTEYGAEVCGIGKPFPTVLEPHARIPFGTKADVSVQCTEDDIDNELLLLWNQARFLDDIVEDEEEPSTTSGIGRSFAAREALADKEDTLVSPLRILSKETDLLDELAELAAERLSTQAADDDSIDLTDEELERAMAASISSIKSHEILSRMVTEFPEAVPLGESFATAFLDSKASVDKEASEKCNTVHAIGNKDADIATASSKPGINLSSIENVTVEPREGLAAKSFADLKKEPRRKEESLLTRLKLRQLSCCVGMTSSTTSSVATNTEQSGLGPHPLKAVKVVAVRAEETKVVAPLPREVARQITDQLRNAGLGAPPDPIPFVRGQTKSNCSSPIRSGIPQAAFSLKDLRRQSATNPAPAASASLATPSVARVRKDSDPARRPAKPKGKERRDSAGCVAAASSEPPVPLPSPYSKLTNAKPATSGAYSSGHGSDETSSNTGGGHSLLPQPNHRASFLGNGCKNRPRNRESFSASSGYESADYGKCRPGVVPSSTVRTTDGIKKPTVTSIVVQKEIEALREQRDSLKQQLSEARKLIGLDEEVVLEDEAKYAQLAPEILVDLLKQETRQLEKKLVTCRNRIMMVTTFL